VFVLTGAPAAAHAPTRVCNISRLTARRDVRCAGVAAHDLAGPAVLLSFMLAAFASFLAALCYTEFAVEARSLGAHTAPALR
jgi:hypothetical protein